MSDGSTEWVSQVAGARRGDRIAIEKLEGYFSPFIHGLLLARLATHVAQPLVKKVLEQALQRLNAVPRDEGFGPLVIALARNRANEVSLAPGSTREAADGDAQLGHARALLTKVRLLPESTRERLLLRLLEGIPGAEISQLTQSRESDVRVDLERGAASLVPGVNFANDSYLWATAGTPNPALVPIENHLALLRFESEQVLEMISTSDELTPSGALSPLRHEPVGRKQTPPTGTVPASHVDDELEDRTMGIGVDLPKFPDAPAGSPRAANPFSTAIKTIAVPDLPAAGDFSAVETDPRKVDPRRLGVESGESTDPRQDAGPPVAAPPRIEATRQAPVLETRLTPLEPEPPTSPQRKSAPRPAPRQPAPEPEPSEAHGQPLGSSAEPPATELRQMRPPTREAPSRPAPESPRRWQDNATLSAPPLRLAPGSALKGAGPFMIAGALALIAIGISWLLLEGSAARVKRGWNLVPVAVATTDLPEGTTLTLEMISTRAVPEQFITSSVVKPENVTYITNQRIMVPVQAGDPLLWSQFESTRSAERLSNRVALRARAVTLPTDRTGMVGGWVQAGDRIDVIAVIRKGGAEDDRDVFSVTILQDMPVVAIGKITNTTNTRLLKPGEKEGGNITLLMLPEEAEMATLAGYIAKLRLVLRTDGDHDISESRGFSGVKTLIEGERVRLLEKKRLGIIQVIRTGPGPAPVEAPTKL